EERLAEAVDEREIEVEDHGAERLARRHAPGREEAHGLDAAPADADPRPEADAIGERDVEPDAGEEGHRRRAGQLEPLSAALDRAPRVGDLDAPAEREVIGDEDVGGGREPEARRARLA